MSLDSKPKLYSFFAGFIACLLLIAVAVIVYFYRVRNRIETAGGTHVYFVQQRSHANVDTILKGIQPTIISYLEGDDRANAIRMFGRLKELEDRLDEKDIKDLKNAHKVFVGQLESSKNNDLTAPAKQYVIDVKNICDRH